MPPQARRWFLVCFIAILLLLVFNNFSRLERATFKLGKDLPTTAADDGAFQWAHIPQQYPIIQMSALPSGRPVKIPQIQHNFKKEAESQQAKADRAHRLDSVKKSFAHAWNGYKKFAWLKDEVSPISGGSRDVFGGWAATLVDSLDTLWIMGFKDDFDAAVADVVKIDFSKSSEEEINVFETTIRYLGGFLSAYDLSGRKVLLDKAVELGEMLYVAFDTPNRMPVTRWKWREYASHVHKVSVVYG